MPDIAAITSTTIVSRSVFGNKRIVMGYITLGNNSDTLPTGGLSLTPSDLSLSEIEFITFETKSAAYYYDYDNEMVEGAGTGPGDGLKFNVDGGAIVPADGEVVRFFAVGYGAG